MPRRDRSVRITTATRSRSEDISLRQRRYLISMTIRTVCFVLAVFSVGHWYLWMFLAGSFFLPYVAVVVANAGSYPDTSEDPSPFGPDPSVRQLEAPRDHRSQTGR